MSAVSMRVRKNACQRVRNIVTLEHAFHVLDIMLAARESSAQGRALPIQSTFIPPVFEPAKTEAIHLMHDRSRSQSEA